MSTRREFIKQTAVVGLASTTPSRIFHRIPRKYEKSFPICIFSKHLQFLPSYEAAAEFAAQVGFDGVDLAVRPKGHVLPEHVGRDLPKAVGAMKAAGLLVPMMTTAIREVDSPHAKEIIALANGLGIQFYRMGYLHYDKELGVRETLESLKEPMEQLEQLNASYGMHGAYQNHDGKNIGAPLWDIWELVKDRNPAHMGIQYDIRHAYVEGGKSWPIDLEYIQSHIRTLVIKDFHWAQREDGSWYVKNVPLGEGMVDFDAYFNMLKKLDVKGPISYHIEYDHYDEGDSLESKKEKTLAAMSRDLQVLRSMLEKAGLQD